LPFDRSQWPQLLLAGKSSAINFSVQPVQSHNCLRFIKKSCTCFSKSINNFIFYFRWLQKSALGCSNNAAAKARANTICIVNSMDKKRAFLLLHSRIHVGIFVPEVD